MERRPLIGQTQPLELNPELKQAQVGSAYVAEIQRTGKLPPVDE